jgi:hypothetical protein
VLITGYSKKDHHCLIGSQDGDEFKPLGTMELGGVTAQHRRLVWPHLGRSIIEEIKDFVFEDPLITCRVKHRGLSHATTGAGGHNYNLTGRNFFPVVLIILHTNFRKLF